MEASAIRNQALELFTSDPSLAGLVMRGYLDFESFNGPERVRFTNLNTRSIHSLETVRQMCEAGDLEWDVLTRMERISYPSTGSPGFNEWWERPNIRNWYSEEAQAQIDGIMRDGPAMGLTSMPDWRDVEKLGATGHSDEA